MFSKSNLIAIILSVALLCFAGGYWLGTEKTLNYLNKQQGARAKQIEDLELALEQSKINRDDNLETSNKNQTNLSSNQNKLSLFEAGQQEPQNKLAIQSDNSKSSLNLPENATVLEMLDYLAALTADPSNEHVDKFRPMIDRIEAAISNNPENLQLLIDHFVESDIDSKMPYYIISMLQSTEIADKQVYMDNLVARLKTQGTASANKRLLHLVSSTGIHHENEELISTIKNIALYSQTDDTNRTYALDLLMPYQLNKSEKHKVVSDLTFALSQAPSEEVSYMIENIIRYSDKTQRAQLAREYLGEANSFETRVAILTTMHNGSVTPSDDLKEALFSIAQNDSDPLSKHARDTLIYVFDINNSEYQRLRDGG
jgi:hypothetical protein